MIIELWENLIGIIGKVNTKNLSGRIFFNIFLFVCLLNVFYFPSQYTDRFFTSGMIWLGIIVPLFFCLFVFFINGPVKLSCMWLYITGLMILSGIYAWMVGTFSMQQLSFLLALCLMFLLLVNSGEYLKSGNVYLLISGIAFLESVLGIAQYFRWYEVFNSNFPVTGTFENPAGLAAYLAISSPFTFFFITCKSLKWKIWGIISSIVLITAVALSLSRSGMIALLAIIILVVCRYLTISRKARRILLFSGFIIGFFFLSVLYFMKKDSADGRLLIWHCTWEMIREKPMLGHGPATFEGQYMIRQARYLTQLANERWNWLAGNVKHPFNELLKLTSEYGIIGLIAIGILLFWLFRLYRRSDTFTYFLFLSLVALVICSFFSYPLNYPSVWILLFLVLGLINRESRVFSFCGKWLRVVILLCCVGLVGFTLFWKYAELKWYQIAHRSLVGKTEEVLPDYAKLHPFMKENPLFLYNYGAELHEIGRWQESASILLEGINRLNDTDVQMLLADNYLKMENYRDAEDSFLLASQMCPNRFLPLYNLVKLYEQTGRQTEALRLAAEIVRKPVKVPSYTIEKIKKDMSEYISSVR